MKCVLFDLESVLFKMESVLFGVESVLFEMESVLIKVEMVNIPIQNNIKKLTLSEDDLPPVLVKEEPLTFDEEVLLNPASSVHIQEVIEDAKAGPPIEFSFVDDVNVLCSLCSEIVAHETLFGDHLPNKHPDLGAYYVVPNDEIEIITGQEELIDSEQQQHQQRRDNWG
jgi:hypothetical protein